MLPFEVGRGRNVFYKIEEGFHMPKQGFALEPQGIEPLFIDAFFYNFGRIDAFFLQFWSSLWEVAAS
ncbi:hypothetical protein COD72_13740 [Bacillus cereus]|nr:hypothetical protein COD72_13740 [Bacillus cereus]